MRDKKIALPQLASGVGSEHFAHRDKPGLMPVDHSLKKIDDERAANPCIGRERADLVLAGCAILEEIRAAFPTPRIRVADRGLREGILALMMRDDGTYGSAP